MGDDSLFKKYIIVIMVIIIIILLIYIYNNRKSHYAHIGDSDNMSNLVDLNKKFLKLNADQQKLKQSVLNMNNSGFAGFNEFKSHSKGETEYKDGLD